MCYRTSIPKKDRIKMEARMEYFSIKEYQDYFHVSGHSYPNIPVATTEEPRVIQPFRWGMIPHWFKYKEQDPTLRKTEMATCAKKFLNVRSDKFNTTYRSMQKERCLIFVDGFYEHRWEDPQGKVKTPFFIFHEDQRPFTMGGLYQKWVDKDSGEVIESVGIITTEPNKMMAYIHNNKLRMPMIVEDKDWELWLDAKADTKQVEALMRPAPEDYLQAYIIDNSFASPKVDANVPATQRKLRDMPDIDAKGTLF